MRAVVFPLSFGEVLALVEQAAIDFIGAAEVLGRDGDEVFLELVFTFSEWEDDDACFVILEYADRYDVVVHER